MKAIDCYWQDWAIRIDAPEHTIHCEDNEVGEVLDSVKKSTPTKIEIKEVSESEGQAPSVWAEEKRLLSKLKEANE